MRERAPILVAEDDDDDFFLLRRAVRDAGIDHPLLRFRDGSELIRFLEQIPPAEMGRAAHQPWLAWIDLTMPIVNGFELLEWDGERPRELRLLANRCQDGDWVELDPDHVLGEVRVARSSGKVQRLHV